MPTIEPDPPFDVKKSGPQPTVWEMPRPRFPFVTWRNWDRSGPECYGIITRVYTSMVDMVIFADNMHIPPPRAGVKHVSDPSLRDRPDSAPGGVWDLCEGEKTLLELEKFMKWSSKPKG